MTEENPRYWAIRYTQVWRDATARSKVCDIPSGTVVEYLNEEIGLYKKVIYHASRDFEGWVYAPYLELVEYIYPEGVSLAGKTESEQDLDQYVIIDGQVQYNLCGELCIANIYGLDLAEMLSRWQAFPTSVFNRIFYGGRSRTTGPTDLLNMADAMGPNQQILATEAFLDSKIKYPIFSPGRLKRWIDLRYGVILGVRIARNGQLRSSGILHWVRPLEVIPDGPEKAVVVLYNPACNRPETYSWYEFTQSVRTPYGVLVKPIEDKGENV